MKDKVTEALLPCPFCGGEAIILTDGRCRVRCSKCYVTMPGVHRIEKEKAVNDWNRRTALRSGELVVVESIPLAKRHNSEDGWTVDYRHIEHVLQQARNVEPSMGMEEVEAVIMAMADLGYASLQPRQDGE